MDALRQSEDRVWQDVESAARRLYAYCSSSDWAGYDPYDALNSPLFQLPVLNQRIPRLVATQLLKRSPFSIRGLMAVPKTQNPKAMALFLTSLLRAPELGDEKTLAYIKSRIIALRSPGTKYWCWGYSFPWQTRTLLVPRGVPNLVCSVFVGLALLDLHDRRGDEDCLTITESTADYILNELYWEKGEVAGLGYPLPEMRHQIHNANLLGAAFLVRVFKLTGTQRYFDAAMKLARYSAGAQREDGSWAYGEGSTQQWVDNFHTGYNLSALRQIDEALGTNEFGERIRRGFDFYCSHFFLEDGTARYYHNNTYPIDIHCVAQSILTLVEFKHLRADGPAMALKVFEWVKANMWSEGGGYFYYRVLRFCKIRTPYMRWTEAWMLLALATLCEEHRGKEQSKPEWKSAHEAVR